MCGVILVGDVSLHQSLACREAGKDTTTGTTDGDRYY